MDCSIVSAISGLLNTSLFAAAVEGSTHGTKENDGTAEIGVAKMGSTLMGSVANYSLLEDDELIFPTLLNIENPNLAETICGGRKFSIFTVVERMRRTTGLILYKGG